VSKKVAIVGTVGLPAKYGGFETLADFLTLHLAQQYELTVYCSSKDCEDTPKMYNGAQLRYVPIRANGVQSILYDVVSIFRALRYADTILILGVSGCVVLPFLKRLSRRRFVVNIDGLEWKREKWSGFAKWFLKLSEKLAVSSADFIITDNKVIQDYVLSEYSKPSSLIAYGGDQASNIAINYDTPTRYPFLKQSYAFSVCRIEPENNLHMILEAASQSSALPLVVIGNWDASEYGRTLRATYSSVDGIHLLGPIYDQSDLDQLRSNCQLYLHGHSAGGTNPSLVEAMSLGLPVFAFDVGYNRETTENSAAYFSSSVELAGMLASLDELTLKGMGEKLAHIAARRYRWELIAAQYSKLLG
jgi:glycosyltransferase involved in cell wall biosynthesis